MYWISKNIPSKYFLMTKAKMASFSVRKPARYLNQMIKDNLQQWNKNYSMCLLIESTTNGHLPWALAIYLSKD